MKVSLKQSYEYSWVKCLIIAYNFQCLENNFLARWFFIVLDGFTLCQVLYIFFSLWFKVLIIVTLSKWLPGNINIQMYSDYLCCSEFYASPEEKGNKRNKSVSFSWQVAGLTEKKMNLSWILRIWKLSINQDETSESFYQTLEHQRGSSQNGVTSVRFKTVWHP